MQRGSRLPATHERWLLLLTGGRSKDVAVLRVRVERRGRVAHREACRRRAEWRGKERDQVRDGDGVEHIRRRSSSSCLGDVRANWLSCYSAPRNGHTQILNLGAGHNWTKLVALTDHRGNNDQLRGDTDLDLAAAGFTLLYNAAAHYTCDSRTFAACRRTNLPLTRRSALSCGSKSLDLAPIAVTQR